MRIAGRLALQRPLSNDRRVEREPVRVETTMRALGYHGIDIVVRNISPLGFKADVVGDFPPGCYVRLRLPGLGTVHARIVWAKDGSVGGEFCNPVDPGRLGRIVGMARA